MTLWCKEAEDCRAIRRWRSLLAQHRGKRNEKALPRLTVRMILGWADAFYARHGTWPLRVSGSIPESPGDTWHLVDSALSNGHRGLKSGSSLPRLLAKYRGVSYAKGLKPLSLKQILAWADAHFARVGSGRIVAAVPSWVLAARDGTGCPMRFSQATRLADGLVASQASCQASWCAQHHESSAADGRGDSLLGGRALPANRILAASDIGRCCRCAGRNLARDTVGPS